MDIEISVYGQCLPQTLNAAGVVCLLEDDHRSAMAFHRRALQIQQKSLDEENKYEMYETLVLIGNVYYSERNNLTNIQSKGVDYKEFIESGFLGWIAKAHDMRGEYIKACQFYEESLQIAISKERREPKKEMALTLNRLGSLNRELGRYEEVSLE
jgi:tetratricopeptide (TPR) repeat protein